MSNSQPNPSHATALVRAQLQARKSQQQPIRLEKERSGADDVDRSRQRDRLQQLAREVQRLETTSRHAEEQPATSTGCVALDECLPHGGYVPGSIIEYLRATPGCGASYLALAAAAAAMRASEGFLVIASTKHDTYPPALLSHGIALDKTIFVRPESQADLIWSVDQALRTPAVSAVFAELELLDDRAARRLQLAAEHGRSLGLLLRTPAARRSPSWSEVQWVVRGVATPGSHSNPHSDPHSNPHSNHSGNRNIDVQLARVRGGQVGATLRLQIHATTGEIAPRVDVRQTQAVGKNHSSQDNSSHNTVRERNRHEQSGTSTSAMHLATELASATRSSRRAQTG
jgi:protein ImuA